MPARRVGPLTSGAVTALWNAWDGYVGEPTVQILSVDKVRVNGSDQRFRLTISDGTHSMNAMLEPEISHMVEGGQARIPVPASPWPVAVRAHCTRMRARVFVTEARAPACAGENVHSGPAGSLRLQPDHGGQDIGRRGRHEVCHPLRGADRRRRHPDERPRRAHARRAACGRQEDVPAASGRCGSRSHRATLSSGRTRHVPLWTTMAGGHRRRALLHGIWHGARKMRCISGASRSNATQGCEALVRVDG